MDRTIETVSGKKVWIGMPRAHYVERESIIAAGQAQGNTDIQVTVQDKPTSLPQDGFNCLFTSWLKDEEQAEFWLLLHADLVPVISPERMDTIRTWLKPMVDQCLAGNYDVLHACAAIKDNRALTSTAVGSIANEWLQCRRITIREAYLAGLHRAYRESAKAYKGGKVELVPQHFDYEDVSAVIGQDFADGCLLCNTGCMLIRRGPWCDQFPGFNVLCKIENGTPLVIPEDWNFGRWCAKNGLRVGGTVDPCTRHYGMSFWTTENIWGDDTDKYFHAWKEKHMPERSEAHTNGDAPCRDLKNSLSLDGKVLASESPEILQSACERR